MKVLAVSGAQAGPHGDRLEEARELGAVAALAKPFGIDALLGAVREALGG